MTEHTTEYRREQYIKQYITICKNGLSVDSLSNIKISNIFKFISLSLYHYQIVFFSTLSRVIRKSNRSIPFFENSLILILKNIKELSPIDFISLFPLRFVCQTTKAEKNPLNGAENRKGPRLKPRFAIRSNKIPMKRLTTNAVATSNKTVIERSVTACSIGVGYRKSFTVRVASKPSSKTSIARNRGAPIPEHEQ